MHTIQLAGIGPVAERAHHTNIATSKYFRDAPLLVARINVPEQPTGNSNAAHHQMIHTTTTHSRINWNKIKQLKIYRKILQHISNIYKPTSRNNNRTLIQRFRVRTRCIVYASFNRTQEIYMDLKCN
jgi:hypothetical protein